MLPNIWLYSSICHSFRNNGMHWKGLLATLLIDHSLDKMSRVNGDSTHPKHRITATDRVANPTNASVPVLSSHQAAADAAEAKHLANAQLLEAAGAPTLAPGGTSTSTTVPGYQSQLHRYSERDTFNKHIKYHGMELTSTSGSPNIRRHLCLWFSMPWNILSQIICDGLTRMRMINQL